MGVDKVGPRGLELIPRAHHPVGFDLPQDKGTKMTEQSQGSTPNLPAPKDTTPARQLVSELATTASVAAATADPNELMMSALTDIATASSEAELFAANESGGIPSLRDNPDLVGPALNVYEVQFVQSADEYAESGLGTFVIVNALSDRGAEIQFNTGASNVVATMFKANQMGLISAEKPWRIVITSKSTKSGTLYRVGQAKV